MTNKLKFKGFSLVEVLIMFTMLSVVMAASMTMITKKISAVPPKISHGIYRCISNGGSLLEEQYNGSNLISSRSVSSCTFNVPKAPMYKVSIYSAGSGGTKGAHIDASQSGTSSHEITLDNAKDFFSNGGDKYDIYQLSDKDYYDFLNGKYIVDSVYTADAGFGGGVTLTYPSVIDSSCISQKGKTEVEKRIREIENEIYNLRNNINYDEIVRTNNGRWAYSILQGSTICSRSDQICDLKGVIANCRPDDCYPKIYNTITSQKTLYDYYGNKLNFAKLETVENGWDNTWDWTHDDPHPLRVNLKKLIVLIADTLTVNTKYSSVERIKNLSAFFKKAEDPVYNKYINDTIKEINQRWEYVLADDKDGNELEYDSVANLAWALYESHPEAHVLRGTRDKYGDDTHSWGVQITHVVNDIIHYAIEERIKELQKEKDELEYMLMRDLPKNARFTSLYNERSVMNDEVKKLIRDYCMVEFKPYYKGMKGWSYTNLTNIDNEITFGGSRVVMVLGGNEGLGTLSRLIYQINYNKNSAEKFTNYISNIKSTYYPLRCATNTGVGCTKCEEGNTCFIRGSDANITGNQLTYLPLGTTIDHNKIRSVNYSDDKDNTAKFTKDSSKKRYPVLNPAGGAPYYYISWQTPIGKKNVVRQNATGGKKPDVYVDESNPNKYVRPTNYCDFTAWYCKYGTDYFFIKNVAYQAYGNKGYNGVDIIHDSYQGNGYSIQGMKESDAKTSPVKTLYPFSGSPMHQEPYMTTSSWIWSKTYSLGSNGNKGKVVSSTETDLGTNCTFSIPKGGVVLRYGIDDASVLSKKLSTTMICKKSDGKVVFNKTVDGNGYNNSLKSGSGNVSNNYYLWNKGINENGGVHTVRLASGPAQPNWKPTSIWSKLFNIKMNYNGGYDIQTKYNVGAAGAGTTLNDKCLARKGKFYGAVYYKTKSKSGGSRYRVNEASGCLYKKSGDSSCTVKSTFYGGPISETIATSKDSERTEYAYGNYKGYNCYGVGENDKNATASSFNLYENSPLVQSGLMQMTAGPGGGGAVVIVW